jgi:CRISPR-associated protein Cas5h
MSNDEFLIFDVWADYAHFKKYYTTSSPLTFSIPPRTALIGLISGIIGLGKEKYLEVMKKDKAKVAVRIINPIKKIRVTQNLINTKGGYWVPVKKPRHEPRTQIRFEYLKEPKFRVYFSHTNPDIHISLKQNLENHKSIYTPYLGITECIADFRFVIECSVYERLNGRELIDVHTILPVSFLQKMNLQPGNKYFKERIPTEILPGRIVTEYREVLYEVEGKMIKAKVKEALRLSNGDVITSL